MMRVVSLLPSATEIVCALGHPADLVGRSAECDHPAEVRSLPVVMAARAWDGAAPSAVIDARVRAARGRGESLYSLDVPLLRELRPDLLLTQDLCGVCSVTGSEVDAACAEAGIRPTVVSLTPRSLDEVWNSIETVGVALEDLEAGIRLAGELRRRSAFRPADDPPIVAVLEWLDPPILAGLWTPDMILRAGGVPMGTESGTPGVRTDWPTLAYGPPDLVIVSPCSFSVERTELELDRSPARAALASLSPRLGTFVVDEAYFSRPGPRLADGIDLVRHLIARDVWSPPMPVRALDTSEIAA
ncbi:MAG: cobalamin-binding protein [Thermoplasmata archaeon]|jgi:iron complex transport system substrate-binding protein|nr:cobalamin-binding protein [Thermoplasmata archaeon]